MECPECAAEFEEDAAFANGEHIQCPKCKSWVRTEPSHELNEFFGID